MKEEGHKIPDYQSLKDDPETYKTINSLDLSLIFQLDGNSGMKQAIKEIKPSNYNDLVALIALYRPGPKDNIPTYAKNKHSGVFLHLGIKSGRNPQGYLWSFGLSGADFEISSRYRWNGYG